MFGMLDYRAYKLLWLLCLPLRVSVWIAAWCLIFIAIMFSAPLNYPLLVRIVIAYAIWEGAALVLGIINAILVACIKAAFFWLVEVIPAKGRRTSMARPR